MLERLGLRKRPQSSPVPARATAPDTVAAFPRGLPDNDRNKPLGTAQWIASTQAHDLLADEDGKAWGPGRLLLGRDSAGRYVGYADDRHILTVAGSRAGKGVSLIVPALLTYPGSVIAIDPKGELASITACRRSSVDSEWSMAMDGPGKVYVLDPFERVTGPATDYRAGFNPLDDLDPDTDEGLQMAGQIADSIVMQIEGPGSHWTQSARAFLRGLVLYVAKTAAPADRHLIRVRELLLQGPDDFDAMLAKMAKVPGVIARAANSLLSKPDNEKASVRSTCDVQTDFLEGGTMAAVLTRHDFRLEDMKAGRVTVYLCLPATRLGTHGRWLRMMIGLTIEAMERTGPIGADKLPVLFCLDEFAALGHMESIEKAAGQIAGFGVKLWPVVQDLTQLQRDYKQAWQTFMGNAGLLTFFGNTDLETLEHVSKRLGIAEVVRVSSNVTKGWQTQSGENRPSMFASFIGQGAPSTSSGASDSGNRADNETVTQAPLMHPDEIARHFARDVRNVLAFVHRSDLPPFVLNRCAYFSETDDALFAGLFEPLPEQPRPRTTAAARRLPG